MKIIPFSSRPRAAEAVGDARPRTIKVRTTHTSLEFPPIKSVAVDCTPPPRKYSTKVFETKREAEAVEENFLPVDELRKAAQETDRLELGFHLRSALKDLKHAERVAARLGLAGELTQIVERVYKLAGPSPSRFRPK